MAAAAGDYFLTRARHDVAEEEFSTAVDAYGRALELAPETRRS